MELSCHKLVCHSSSIQTTNTDASVLASDTKDSEFGSSRNLTFECQKIAKNLTLKKDKLPKIVFFSVSQIESLDSAIITNNVLLDNSHFLMDCPSAIQGNQI